MIGLSSDKQIVVLINKTFVTNFESVLTEIKIFDFGALKSIENHEIRSYYRLLSNFDWISS